MFRATEFTTNSLPTKALLSSMLLISCTLSLQTTQAQQDIVFWFAAPEVATSAGDAPIFLRFMTYNAPSNDNLIVEINSHTDNRGSDDYNRKLAQRRAKSCVDYLIEKGISKERHIAKGYGEDQPNYLKDEKKKPVLDENGNRIYLTEAYIDNQKVEATREEFHQRNRRTSFTVVGEGFEQKSR